MSFEVSFTDEKEENEDEEFIKRMNKYIKQKEYVKDLCIHVNDFLISEGWPEKNMS